MIAKSERLLKPGFHISQLIGDLLSGIAEGENDIRNTKDLSIVDHRQGDHKDIADELRYMKTRGRLYKKVIKVNYD